MYRKTPSGGLGHVLAWGWMLKQVQRLCPPCCYCVGRALATAVTVSAGDGVYDALDGST